MADAIVGKWKSDLTSVEGFEDFKQATGHADKWPAEPQDTLLDISRNGDEWTVTSQSGDRPPHTTTLKEGEKKTTQGFEGGEIELEGRVEGDRWVVVINSRGNTINSVVYVDNDQLVQEQTLKGATLRTRFNRA